MRPIEGQLVKTPIHIIVLITEGLHSLYSLI